MIVGRAKLKNRMNECNFNLLNCIQRNMHYYINWQSWRFTISMNQCINQNAWLLCVCIDLFILSVKCFVLLLFRQYRILFDFFYIQCAIFVTFNPVNSKKFNPINEISQLQFNFIDLRFIKCYFIYAYCVSFGYKFKLF